jgi:hypothetical protein
MDENDGTVVRLVPRESDQCELPEFGASVPETGTAHLIMRKSGDHLVKFGKIDARAGNWERLKFEMVYRPDADDEAEYTWLLADQSTQELRITGTDHVGPVQGVIRNPEWGHIRIRIPNDLAGEREWLKFVIRKDGEVIHEKFVFINID